MTSLIEKVESLLISQGLVKECLNLTNDPRIIECRDKHNAFQKIKLNDFWTDQLVSFGSESMNQRYCLLNDCTDEEWIRMFQSSVLPFAVSKSLPRPL